MQRQILDNHRRVYKLLGMIFANSISAVIFDMDGTLVDSEIYTVHAAIRLCAELGIDNANFDCWAFEGLSWKNISKYIVRDYPALTGKSGIPDRLHEIYHKLLKNNPPPEIRKARQSVVAAYEHMPTAIVSSSYRESIEETIRRMNIASYISFYAGADDYQQAKPAPDGYLKAAEFLGVDVEECLVFEDSITGIQAALGAGMRVIAITRGGNSVDQAVELADMAIRDFSELKDGFFEYVKKGGA